MLALPAAAQDDVEGKWNASVETPQGATQMVFNLMVEDDTLTLTSTFEGGGPPGGGEQTLTAMRAEE